MGHITPYLELTKPRVVPLILMTTAAGFLVASGELVRWWTLVGALVGTGLSAAGANALNQCMEIARDRRMRRTCLRPLPSGVLKHRRAYVWSTALAVSGPLFLLLIGNFAAGALALSAELVYVLLYTPMKTRTALCTLIGGVSGAIPPLIGWCAAAGEIDGAAVVLAAFVFVWQVPHFLAFGWLYRRDYAHGGFRTLPVVDDSGELVSRLILVYVFALIPIGGAMTLVSRGGWVYASGSLFCGVALLVTGLGFHRRRSEAAARCFFSASVAYLSLLLILLVVEPWL